MTGWGLKPICKVCHIHRELAWFEDNPCKMCVQAEKQREIDKKLNRLRRGNSPIKEEWVGCLPPKKKKRKKNKAKQEKERPMWDGISRMYSSEPHYLQGGRPESNRRKF